MDKALVCVCACNQAEGYLKMRFFLKKANKVEDFSLLRTRGPTFPVSLSTVCGLFGASGRTKRREDHSVPPEASPALIGQQQTLLFWLSRLNNASRERKPNTLGAITKGNVPIGFWVVWNRPAIVISAIFSTTCRLLPLRAAAPSASQNRRELSQLFELH